MAGPHPGSLETKPSLCDPGCWALKMLSFPQGVKGHPRGASSGQVLRTR